MLNGSTYIVRPRIEPSKSSFSFLTHRERLFPIIGGPAASFESEQM
jgi:hypothetical protein